MDDDSRPRILNVEDEPDVRELMRLILDDIGDTNAVPDAYQALAAARDDGADVVVLDLLLPGASGIELIARLRAADVPAAFVVVTGMDSGPMIDRAHALGVVDIVVKPFTEDRLRSAVAAALAGRRAAGGRLTPVP